MTVRQLFSAVLGVALIAGALLGSGIARAQGDDPTIQAGVIVQGEDGSVQTFCVTLDGNAPTGLDALEATGLDTLAEQSSMGATVCRLDGVGCTPPGDSCFCQCEGDGPCTYWSYFHLSDAGTWQFSIAGASAYAVQQGDVEGWWWRNTSDTSAAPPPALSFESICGAEAAFPRTVVDGMDHEMTLDTPPQHIASVTLGSDEILLDLVGPDRLLGVSYFADDPAISNISDRLDGIEHTDLSGDPELLISLDADLVVMASYSNPAALEQLEDAQVPVFALSEFNSVDEIRANIRLLGEVTGEETRADALIAEMDARLEAVQDAVAGEDPVRVLYYEPGGITYGPGSTVDEIINLAGGVNVVAEAGLEAYPLVDPEFVLSTDPDVVLVSGWFSGKDDPLGWFTSDPALGTLRAVQEGRVYAINAAHMTNVSQYIAQGVEDVAYALYPQAFPDLPMIATEEPAHD
ncbi:MAG TPA: ABC transporter substrate-binding protein [Aggregatilinea sp.]|uniref:ABC transporter substrate-binding protein n=1 Tax=Aggregatilinea sp. TaxID=2806333 RepID=UPI002CA3833C|nr:ABC transporter substrate-binding protein [Aggregatilinea sp.]HML24888.1 ABC transporter substrate-binding protein [Aggregatilinea sp.]